METWLIGNIPDTNVDIPGFTTMRVNRDAKLSGKSKGGGLVLFVNIRCCTPGHVTVKERICCRDIELLAVSLRPYYMPRELSQAIAVCVYVPPRVNPEIACDVIHATIARLQTQHPDAFITISASVQTTGTTTRVWSPEAEEALKDCYDTTDWSVLLHPHEEDIEGVTHGVTDYLNFCMDVAVPTKTVRCFPNNKRWITSDVKDILNQKKRAFKDGNWTELKRVQGELKVRLKEAKESYRRKVERKLRNNMKEVWGAMKTITGCKNNSGSSVDEGVDRANQFNTFYNRFDCPAPAPAALSSYPPHHPVFTTITLTSTISVITTTLTSTISVIITTISTKTKQRPQFPLPPNLNCRPSQVDSLGDYTPDLRSTMLRTHCSLRTRRRWEWKMPSSIFYTELTLIWTRDGGAVRVMFFDFSSAFNTIQPLLLRDKLMKMEVDMHLVTWITG
ncbi:hypothetical protein NFI96_033082 [Prochilodus magdalenae]|nr:hypothetical protein NFI96_033082 [Prochilodus magdalenae]